MPKVAFPKLEQLRALRERRYEEARAKARSAKAAEPNPAAKPTRRKRRKK